MRTIELTQGFVALVDDEDFELVSRFKWYADRKGRRVYAARNKPRPNRGIIYLHSFLLPGAEEVDHKNGDGLDCQRHNLRPATDAENNQGFQRKRKGCSSRYRGVSWNSGAKKWDARLQAGNKQVCLGLFLKEEDAARARDEKALELGFPPEGLNFP